MAATMKDIVRDLLLSSQPLDLKFDHFPQTLPAFPY
jgi:hypothetical protein